LGEEADAGLEGDHVGGIAIVDEAFGEDEQAEATVCGFAGEAKTFAEARKLRERENIEQRDHQEIAELPEPAFGEEPVAGGWRYSRRVSPLMAVARRWRNRAGSE